MTEKRFKKMSVFNMMPTGYSKQIRVNLIENVHRDDFQETNQLELSRP